MTAPKGRSVEVQIAGSTFVFETGRIARQATGSVLARCGDNVVLATVVAAPDPAPGQSFFPLTVEYREKYAAVGRIPGNYQRREGRISDREVLVSRLIDRTLRSLFPKGYFCEVQIQVQVLSAEPTSDIESLALLAAACALHVSPVPARGPAAGLRIARVDGALLPFPGRSQRQRCDLDFTVGSGPDGLVMLEGDGREVPEAACLEALEVAEETLARFRAAFDALAREAGVEKPALPDPGEIPEPPEEILALIRAAMEIAPKRDRHQALDRIRNSWIACLPPEAQAAGGQGFDRAHRRETREMILGSKRRPDGRGPTDIRPIWSEVGILPRAHGSAVFTRGETQAIATCTLASLEEAPRDDSPSGTGESERFLLHYNFPPYSVGEIRPLRGPGRREIGHGSLARRGLLPVLPDPAAFPYTIRVESEITESNGSSSMATVCAGTLAMLAAGIPLSRPAAGIAMGLIADGDRRVILSDILGDEDHLGDMDFKVVGTEKGVTAIQLDNKIGGLPLALLAEALEQARRGRLGILAEMARTLQAPAEPSRFVPRALRTAIMPDAVGALIGQRGANIKAITEATGARVSVDDDGSVTIYATESGAAKEALAMVHRSAGVLRVNRCYRGTVTGVKDFGAFVRVNAVNEGLVPVEELDSRPVRNPLDVVKEGDEVVVLVLGSDDRGRLRLSRRQALGVPESEIEF